MSEDDILLRPDGTRITAVDIAILKFARIIAGIFLKKEDTNYDRAYRIMQRIYVAIFIVAEVFLCIDIGPSMIPASVFLIFFWVFPLRYRKRCNGLGTNIPSKFKWLTLGALVIMTLVEVPLIFWDEGVFWFLSCVFLSMSFFCNMFTIGYVARLGNRKIRKKKRARAKAFKPAFGQAGV